MAVVVAPVLEIIRFFPLEFLDLRHGSISGAKYVGESFGQILLFWLHFNLNFTILNLVNLVSQIGGPRVRLFCDRTGTLARGLNGLLHI